MKRSVRRRLGCGFGVLALLAAIVALFMALIAPPHYFIVSVDEPAASASITLNQKTQAMTRIGSYFFARHPLVEDGAGTIRVKLSSGGTVDCGVGYVTHSEPEPHTYGITHRVCRETS